MHSGGAGEGERGTSESSSEGGVIEIVSKFPLCTVDEPGHVQRNKIRRMYGISVEDAPLGEYCDGQLHDYCVVQCCPCLSLIQVWSSCTMLRIDVLRLASLEVGVRHDPHRVPLHFVPSHLCPPPLEHLLHSRVIL